MMPAKCGRLRLLKLVPLAFGSLTGANVLCFVYVYVAENVVLSVLLVSIQRRENGLACHVPLR